MIELKTSSFERIIKSKLPSGLKSFFAFFLINVLVGKIIKLIKIKRNLLGGLFDYSLVSDHEASSIFWGVWEAAEIRFAKRFAKSSTIIELGSSVGVTLGVLANNRKNTKFICLEASLINFNKLSTLKNLLPHNNNYILINKAIAYGVESIQFEHTSTTGSKVLRNKDQLMVKENIVPATTLSKLICEYEIKETYTLITDIEGAEAVIFFEDFDGLRNCKEIIAELEDTNQYSIIEQINQLENIGFTLIERYGNVVFMLR